MLLTRSLKYRWAEGELTFPQRGSQYSEYSLVNPKVIMTKSNTGIYKFCHAHMVFLDLQWYIDTLKKLRAPCATHWCQTISAKGHWDSKSIISILLRGGAAPRDCWLSQAAASVLQMQRMQICLSQVLWVSWAVCWLEGHWAVCGAAAEQPAWWRERDSMTWTPGCQMLCFLSSLHYHETVGPVERFCLTPREVEDFSESFPYLGLIEGSQTCGIQCGVNKHLVVSTWRHHLCVAVTFPLWAPGELLQCPVQCRYYCVEKWKMLLLLTEQ